MPKQCTFLFLLCLEEISMLPVFLNTFFLNNFCSKEEATSSTLKLDYYNYDPVTESNSHYTTIDRKENRVTFLHQAQDPVLWVVYSRGYSVSQLPTTFDLAKIYQNISDQSTFSELF